MVPSPLGEKVAEGRMRGRRAIAPMAPSSPRLRSALLPPGEKGEIEFQAPRAPKGETQ
jgi:hypothetical protein